MAKPDPMENLKSAGTDFLSALGERALGTVSDKIGGLTDRLEDIADGGPVGKAVAKGGEESAQGGSAVTGALKGAASGIKDKVTGGGGKGSPKATKATNIIEQIDVGVPVSVAYNQWTQFADFASFMKKVEKVEAKEEEELEFKAQIFWSHRVWRAQVIEQVPDERIVWRSSGEKGHVDGAVTFHEIGPNLTRILVVLEYYPQGFMERTGNIWRAQGRRVRAELKHFRRHVMTRTILEPDEVEGWRGVIEEGEVVKSHDEVLDEEEEQQQDGGEQEEEDYEGDEEPEGEAEEFEEPEDEEPEDEAEEYEDDVEEPEDEAEEYEDDVEEPEDEAEEPEDEEEYPAEDEDPEEEKPRRRRRRAS